METSTVGPPPSVEREVLALRQVEAEIRKVLVGQDDLVERLLVGLLARGHVLLEGVPGLAKTLAVKTLARTLALEFKRVQFTPDLLPADLVGTLDLRSTPAASSPPSAVRSSPTSCSPTRSTARPPRCSRRCSRRWKSGR